MRLICPLDIKSQVVCACYSSDFAFIGVAAGEIIVVRLDGFKVAKRIKVRWLASAMCVIQDRILIYARNDGGYGSIFFREKFRLVETVGEAMEDGVWKVKLQTTKDEQSFALQVVGQKTLGQVPCTVSVYRLARKN